MYVTAMTEERCMDLKESKDGYMRWLGGGGRNGGKNDMIRLESQKMSAPFSLIQVFFFKFNFLFHIIQTTLEG